MKSLSLLGFGPLCFIALLSAPCRSAADSLVFSYTSPTAATNQVSSGFTVVDFVGSIANTSSQSVTFQLLGGPVPFEPYVASFVSGVPYPGITLAPGQSTPVFDIAIVTINPFDPSLPYPGFVPIVFPAVNPQTGATIAANDLSIEVVTGIPEPSSLLLVLLGASTLVVAFRLGR